MKKAGKKVQWLALLGALLVALQQATQSGIIPPNMGIYILAVTNLLSALLPGIFPKRKRE